MLRPEDEIIHFWMGWDGMGPGHGRTMQIYRSRVGYYIDAYIDSGANRSVFVGDGA